MLAGNAAIRYVAWMVEAGRQLGYAASTGLSSMDCRLVQVLSASPHATL